jgi:uncharacterized Fe-S cluster protein YjdI
MRIQAGWNFRKGHVNGASAAAIIEQVKRCPSGALTYELLEKA